MPATAKDIDRTVQEAATALRNGDLTKARAVARSAIDAGAEHPFLLKIEALWLHKEGQYRDALRTFHHARTLTPGDPTVLAGIATCLSDMGEHEAALKIADAALEMAPDLPSSIYLRGWILEAAEDLPGARQAYERALLLSPGHVEALAGLASVAARLGDAATARARAIQVLALKPQQPTATIALAIAKVSQGDATGAADRLQGLLQMQPPGRIRSLALNVLADALEALGRTEEAQSARRESTAPAAPAGGSAPTGTSAA